MNSSHTLVARRLSYQNLVLTGIAGLLALGLVDKPIGAFLMPSCTAAAQSEQPDAGGLTNALEQRKQIIAELRTINTHLEKIDSRLAGRLEVRVTDMPPLKLPPELKPKPGADKPERGEPKPADSGK
jgi:hypothetical protein